MKKLILLPFLLLTLGMFAQSLPETKVGEDLSTEQKIELFLNKGQFLKVVFSGDTYFYPKTNIHSIHTTKTRFTAITNMPRTDLEFYLDKINISLDFNSNLIIEYINY